MRLRGRLTTSTAEPLVGWRIYAADEPAHAYDLRPVTTGRDGAFVLESDKTLAPGAQPVLTLYVLDGERLVRVIEPPLRWTAEGEAQMDISLSAPPPPVYFLHGRVWDPALAAPVTGATVRTVDRAGVYGEQSIRTDGRGLYDLWLPEREGRAPDLTLGVEVRGTALPVLPQPILWNAHGVCVQWTDLAWDLSGRVTTAEGDAAAGVRVEAWVADRCVATATADAAGGYTLRLPREPGRRIAPQPTLRLYRGAQLLHTVAARATTGTMVKRSGGAAGTMLLRGNVESIRIDGGRATMSGPVVESAWGEGTSGGVGSTAWFAVEDGAPDRFADMFGGGPPAAEMIEFPFPLQPIASGSIAVTPTALRGAGVTGPNNESFEFDATPGLVTWTASGFGRLDVTLEAEADRPGAYAIAGTAIDRTTRRGASGLRVEAWDAPEAFMVAAATTDDEGRFRIELTGEEPPDVRFRFYLDDGRLVGKPELPLRWVESQASVFAEIDVPTLAPKTWRIAGRVIDRSARTGLGGLQIEAWDSAPRDGGALGVVGVTGTDGSFDLVLERVAAPSDGSPSVFFRVYAQDRLLETVTPAISWASGVGTVLLEVGTPPTVSQEVGLHELGESIASTVDRVQAELARYPKTMGAYVLDEIALDMPVEMRVDPLGQVRTKVVDAATPEKNVGHVRMKVRPLVGATEVGSTILDQPLSALVELTSDAIAALEAQRIYSVEDLARTAATGAGRAALNALGLGLDLDRVLEKATLLAFAPLPRAIREALVQLGVTSLKEFAERDAAQLAEQLSVAIGQTITSQDVTAWQATVREALAVPRPSDETQGGPR